MADERQSSQGPEQTTPMALEEIVVTAQFRAEGAATNASCHRLPCAIAEPYVIQ